MTITIDATFENGVLRLKEPLTLTEGMEVRVAITPVDEHYDPPDAVVGICTGGPRDGADNHDKYIYGPMTAKTPKAARKSTKNRK